MKSKKEMTRNWCNQNQIPALEAKWETNLQIDLILDKDSIWLIERAALSKEMTMRYCKREPKVTELSVSKFASVSYTQQMDTIFEFKNSYLDSRKISNAFALGTNITI